MKYNALSELMENNRLRYQVLIVYCQCFEAILKDLDTGKDEKIGYGSDLTSAMEDLERSVKFIK